MIRKDRLYHVATIVMSMVAGAMWCEIAQGYEVTREGDYVWACLDGDQIVSRHDTPYRAQDDCGDLADELGRELRIDFGGLRVTPEAAEPPAEEPEDPPVEEPEEPEEPTEPPADPVDALTIGAITDDSITGIAWPDTGAGEYRLLVGTALNGEAVIGPPLVFDQVTTETHWPAIELEPGEYYIRVCDAGCTPRLFFRVGEVQTPDGTVRLRWTPPTHRTDGTLLDRVSNYLVWRNDHYLTSAEQAFAFVPDSGCYTVTAYAGGRESGHSDELCI